jgi:hypothetical protein
MDSLKTGLGTTDVAVDGEAYAPFARKTWYMTGTETGPAIDGPGPLRRLSLASRVRFTLSQSEMMNQWAPRSPRMSL